ncbi:MAG TPA: hypothetical protein VFL04_06100 [Rectinemataceae bacterium]|nr:hypothetical protein [Rectinemataceae bacterium]
MRIPLALIFAMAAAAFPLQAQSNTAVDELLGQEKAQVGSAAYMTLNAGGLIGEDATPGDALAALVSKGWIAAERPVDSPILLDEYCVLVMRSLGLKGGLMYTLFPGRRYGYRELVARGIVNASGGPRRTLAGDEAIRILRLALDLKGGTQ